MEQLEYTFYRYGSTSCNSKRKKYVEDIAGTGAACSEACSTVSLVVVEGR